MDDGIKQISLILKHHQKDLQWDNGIVRNWVDAWFELVYCILAGSKVHTRVVQKAFGMLIAESPRELLFTTIVLDQDASASYIRRILKKNGYRFYNSKVQTIVNAAAFYVFIFDQLDEYSAIQLRKELVNNVSGIGIKIATHWLRNIGFDFPIVDVHTRNILVKTQMIDSQLQKDNLTTAEYLMIEKVLFNISHTLSTPASSIDYALWKHGMERCQCTIL